MSASFGAGNFGSPHNGGLAVGLKADARYWALPALGLGLDAGLLSLGMPDGDTASAKFVAPAASFRVRTGGTGATCHYFYGSAALGWAAGSVTPRREQTSLRYSSLVSSLTIGMRAEYRSISAGGALDVLLIPDLGAKPTDPLTGEVLIGLKLGANF